MKDREGLDLTHGSSKGSAKADRRRNRDLDYRTFFRAKSRTSRPLTHEFSVALDAWLTEKGLPAQKLQAGITRFDANHVGSLVEKRRQDSSILQKFTLVETRESPGRSPDIWQTEILLSQERFGEADMLIHVTDPRKAGSPNQKLGATGVPRFVRRFLSAVDVFDGMVPLREEATTLSLEDEQLLIDMICDVDRRLPVVVAPAADLESMSAYYNKIERVTYKMIGQAGIFVLASDLVDSLSGEIGFADLPRGGLRVFPPNFDPASATDARQSYFLTGEELQARAEERVKGHWAWMARAAGNSLRLPKKAQKDFVEVSQHNQAQLLTEIDRLLEAQPQIQKAQRVSQNRTAITDNHGVQSEAGPDAPQSSPERSSVSDAGLSAALEESFRGESFVERIQTIGDEATLQESLRMCIEMACEYPNAIAMLEAVKDSQSSASTDPTSISEDEFFTMWEEKEMLEDELKQARNELLVAQRQGRYWKNQITIHDAWHKVGQAPAVSDLREDFTSVIEHANELEFIDFTGNTDHALDLDESQEGPAAANNAHSALEALNDYARAKDDDRFTRGGIREFMQNPPDGYDSISSHKFAASESEQVKCNPRFMQARTFPMPNGEEVRMLMHVKLGQGSLAPRMHLFDDTANSGKIVVGYIGRHLPSNLST